MKVGFVGLGTQGGPIARRIARSGFSLVVNDISAKALEAFDEPGVTREADLIAAAQAVEALCVCVRTDQDLLDLCDGDAVFAALGAGGVFIVHSTVSPDLCRALSVRAKALGVDFIDAGVSGGGPAALEGQLSLFVGGDADAVAKVKSLLDCYAKSVAHLGPVGRGMEGKLLNNLVSVANYGMAAAILDLGDQMNFDREQLRAALMAGSAQGFALKAVPGLLKPHPSMGGTGALRQLLKKDVDHARTLAPASDFSLAALLDAADSMLERLARIERGEADR